MNSAQLGEAAADPKGLDAVGLSAALSFAESVTRTKVTPTTALWPEQDPLFPPARWDSHYRFFADVRLQHITGLGKFTR
ncbi:MAG TPA: hypothetical protein VI074_12195 [Propionibacteriaceae bacterium]